MAKLSEWLLEDAGDEPIEAVVLGEMGWGNYGSDAVPNYEGQPRGKVLSWEEALPWLGYEFDSGFGAPGCNAVVAWTKSWVISVSQYDGATGTFKVARNPTGYMPEMPGG